MAIVWIIAGLASLLVLYLFHVNRGMSRIPLYAAQMTAPLWTENQIKQAYEKCQTVEEDFAKLLPPKTGRRYIVFGGSGLVGGWIVQHLLQRGEDPKAIRIADLAPPKRAAIVDKKIQFIKTDISNSKAVESVFKLKWDSTLAVSPLTVYHVAAYIDPSQRHADFLSNYLKVNVEGTRNILNSAQASGCSAFVATSSASIGLRPFNYFLWPWSSHPRNWLQVSDNADPDYVEMSLDNFTGCYSYSKAVADQLVRKSDSKEQGFRTGVIRPGHAIYGHGEESNASLGYYYLNRGETLTWLPDYVTQFVSAQNVSLAHLLFESRLVDENPSEDIGGKGFAITDPGSPVTYGHLYKLLSTLAHPTTPVSFPRTTPLPFFLLSHIIEKYALLQNRYLPFLPKPTGELGKLQPALFQACTLNSVYDTQKAYNELRFRSNLGSLEGLCLHLSAWNTNVENRS